MMVLNLKIIAHISQVAGMEETFNIYFGQEK
jgi:hypothetical protein